ncbi:MAG: hypothetical protein NDI91_18460 [Sulfuritalea sp.]|nr:hypothetical protein [Sulfuritalea sp.]
MPAELIAKLKKLQYQRSGSSPFQYFVDFLRWSDNVSPLLSFNPQFQDAFKRCVGVAKAQHSSGYTGAEQINEAIGILNQAVLSLETPPIKSSTLSTQGKPILEAPAKVTVKWLYEHVPFMLVLGGFTLLGSAFAGGIAFSETQLYALIKNTIRSTAPIATSPSAYKVENSPNTASHIQPSAKK